MDMLTDYNGNTVSVVTGVTIGWSFCYYTWPATALNLLPPQQCSPCCRTLATPSRIS